MGQTVKYCGFTNTICQHSWCMKNTGCGHGASGSTEKITLKEALIKIEKRKHELLLKDISFYVRMIYQYKDLLTLEQKDTLTKALTLDK